MHTAELRRDIEQRYPGAKIEGLEKKPLIRIIDEEEEKKNPRLKRSAKKSFQWKVKNKPYF